MPHGTNLSSIFRDVTGKPFNADRQAVRLLNRLLDAQEYLLVELPIARLYATQPRINADFRDAARRHCLNDPLSRPAVVKYQGRYYVTDGHHRIANLHAEGAIVTPARLFDLDGDTQIEMPLLQFASAQT